MSVGEVVDNWRRRIQIRNWKVWSISFCVIRAAADMKVQSRVTRKLEKQEKENDKVVACFTSWTKVGYLGI